MLYALLTQSPESLASSTTLFDQHMEPILARLETAVDSGAVRSELPEIRDYLQVCRWPFRKLEYSFALSALLPHISSGSRFLDAGSGVTPFAHVFAALGAEAHACDRDERITAELQRLHLAAVYGSAVAYHTQDLVSTTFPDAYFDAISCISVIEHIPAPLDQRAISELVRILKPGGWLILTVDFAPTAGAPRALQASHYYLKRSVTILRTDGVREFWRATNRRREARRAASAGLAEHPRVANQRLEIDHLRSDFLPALERAGELVSSDLDFPTNLEALTPADARRFWETIPGLYDVQGQRDVLPVGLIFRKHPR